MTIWLLAEIGLLLAVIPCAYVIVRGPTLSDALVGLQLGGTIAVLALVVLAQAMSRPSFYDLAIVTAVLSFASGFMLAHFLERWFR